tara:strand:- start:178 stop:675 length:498 start_codon:yes stop_codon:yes gene_type:complete
MGSKRGVVITVVILVAITIGSFMVWFGNPTNTDMTIVVTDFENHDAGIVERHKIVSGAVEESFSELLNGELSPSEYKKIAEISSSQNNALIIELRSSKAPEEWQETYVNRIGSLENFSSYIIETMVMANLIENGEEEKKDGILENIKKFKQESTQYAQMANSSKP